MTVNFNVELKCFLVYFDKWFAETLKKINN